MLNTIIPEINIQNRCWIIRSDGGQFYEHFLSHSIVAIGHIDILNLKSIEEFNKKEAFETLVTRFMASGKSKKEANRSAGSYLGQASRFLSMKENDYIITVGRSKIAIGQVVGESFIGIKDLKVQHSHNNELNMNLTLRQSVEWQYEVPKKELSNMLSKTFSTPQTVIELENVKKTAIFHTIFPIFLYDKRLFFSININRHQAIKNFHMSEIFSLLNEVEYIARDYNKINFDTSFDEQFFQFKQKNSLKLEVKASFMSPGEIWANILLNYDNYVHIAFFYSLLFGNKVLGFDGLIDKELRHKIFELYKDRMEKRQLEKISEDLRLKEPRHDIE